MGGNILNKIKQSILTQSLAQLYIIHGEEQYLQQEIYTALQQRGGTRWDPGLGG